MPVGPLDTREQMAVLLILPFQVFHMSIQKTNVFLLLAFLLLSFRNLLFLFVKNIVENDSCLFEPLDAGLQSCDLVIAHHPTEDVTLFLLQES